MAVARVQPGSGKGDAPGVGVRVYSSESGVTPGSFIPFCSMAHAQLSFHGHRDAVKMFVAVPGNFIIISPSKMPTIRILNFFLLLRNLGTGGNSAASDNSQPAMLLLSGGEGYIDFRVGKQANIIDQYAPFFFFESQAKKTTVLTFTEITKIRIGDKMFLPYLIYSR